MAVLAVTVSLTVGLAVGHFFVRGAGIESGTHREIALWSIAAFLPALLVLSIWVRATEGRSLLGLCFGGEHRVRKAVLGTVTAAVFFLVLNTVAGILAGDGPDGDAGDGATVSLAMGALLLLGVAVQSSTEEVLFRGYLLPVLRHRWGTAAGVLGSSALFGCAHMFNKGASASYVFMTFLIGVALALWATADGNIWRTCAFHTTWNFIPSLFTPDGQTSDDTAAGQTVAAVIVLIAVILCALWNVRRARPAHRASDGAAAPEADVLP
ncbi:CPBP family intramembrane glutamic endopeptidase [Streptomyces araujoniae]|uniref:CPBP family intramembrane glutamic endopeptidase n=1 Tax=Streptomyces sp. ZEA17I TaxID=2202516 RepID=UPI0015E82CD0|nr:type II CAAX endopeptidase family protein [Streptomyces sp. ZEA17I]